MSANRNQRTRNKRGKSKRRYATAQMQGAPAGVSQDLQQFTKFYPASNGNGVRMHTCAAISEILRETTSATAAAALLQPGGVGISLQLNLTEPVRLGGGGTAATDEYISPVFDLISSAFVRYKINKCIFHYEPQSSATSGERLVFAFAADPVHPILWNSTIPTTTTMLALSDSIAFMPWRGWSMDVTSSLQKGAKFYTYADPTTTVSNVTERFSDYGVLSVSGATLSAGSNAIGGVLYMELDFELMEFCPISSTDPSSKIAMKAFRRSLQEKKGGPPRREDQSGRAASSRY